MKALPALQKRRIARFAKHVTIRRLHESEKMHEQGREGARRCAVCPLDVLNSAFCSGTRKKSTNMREAVPGQCARCGQLPARTTAPHLVRPGSRALRLVRLAQILPALSSAWLKLHCRRHKQIERFCFHASTSVRTRPPASGSVRVHGYIILFFNLAVRELFHSS